MSVSEGGCLRCRILFDGLRARSVSSLDGASASFEPVELKGRFFLFGELFTTRSSIEESGLSIIRDDDGGSGLFDDSRDSLDNSQGLGCMFPK
tara:strand:+ start:6985 stop:7263 length:279 start_codon:yes stop_codon:yes gene_type:complete